MKFKYIEAIESTIPIPESYKDCVELIRSDYYRFSGKKEKLWRMFLHTFIEPSFAFTFWLRMASYKTKNPLYFLSKLIHRHLIFKYSLMIPSSTLIGYGLYLGHPTSIIVNHTAVIGNNVNLSQFTTIGSNHKQAAVIGDNVYIGPSVCLIENVHIGKNVTIGAGSIVTKDIPEGVVAVGNPARVISTENAGRYIGNKWEL